MSRSSDTLRRLSTKPKKPLPPLTLVCAADIEPKKVEWLWRDHIARGFLHLLCGPPSIGKSQATLSFAAAITRGGEWPDGTQCPQGRVLIHSTEDDRDVTIVPRLIAAGADLTRVHFINDRDRLAEAIRTHKPVLVVLDPITSRISDQNDQAKVRDALEPIAQLARETGAAIIGLSHFAKRASELPVIERVLGSTSFVAVARIVMAMASGDQGSAFAVVKSNLGPMPPPRAYSVEPVNDTSRIVWGAVLGGTAESALSKTAPQVALRADEARAFIEDALKDGPRQWSEIVTEAESLCLSEATLRRARNTMGDRLVRFQENHKHLWRLEPERMSASKPNFADLLGI